MANLSELVKAPFLDLAPELAGSLVYLDAGAGEVLSTSLGGLPFLLGEPAPAPHAQSRSYCAIYL